MENSSGSYFSSWPAPESYSFAAASIDSYAEEGSMPPSSYFMNARSDPNLKFNEQEHNSTLLSNGCLAYSAQDDLLSGQILSKNSLSNSLLEVQQLQSSTNQKSNLVSPGVFQRNSRPENFHPQLDTPGFAELHHTLSSSIDSNGSEVSAFLADIHAVSSASTLCSAYENGSSFMDPVNLEAFSFEGAQNDVMLNKIVHPNGNISVLENSALATPPDSKEFFRGRLPSFATIQETNLPGGGFKTQKQEQNTMSDVPIPTFIARNHMAVTTTQGTLIPPKMPLLTNDDNSEGPVSYPSGIQTQANSPNGNGVGVKPRVRARRGQATDPHSIAERLRREKISDRMKNLQDLVPNSNKADKASMLDEIIDYVKFLQLQVKVLSMSRLGAPGTVLPLLSESQTEGCCDQPLSAPTAAHGLSDAQDSEDSEDTLAFEQEVVKLMETSVTSAMQYLQNKGLCLMPVALASSISNEKGTAGAAVPAQR